MSVKFCDSWNERKKELFVNVSGRDPSVVCVDHETFIPCRVCLYEEAAETPYSAEQEDIAHVVELNRRATSPILKESDRKKKR